MSVNDRTPKCVLCKRPGWKLVNAWGDYAELIQVRCRWAYVPNQTHVVCEECALSAQAQGYLFDGFGGEEVKRDYDIEAPLEE
jgi:hypothetical protein